MKNKEKYFGIVPPLLTPLLAYDQIDAEAYKAMVSHVIERGVHGIFSMASSGESLHNTRKVWEEAHKIALNTAKGKIPVYCGAIAPSTAQAIENVKCLEGIGATMAVVTAPFYTPKLFQSEIIRHFETVLAHTNINLCLYNIPSLIGGINISIETARILADHERIVMLKDSSSDWNHQQRIMLALQDKDISLMTGGEAFCVSSILLGAQGNISGFSASFPELFVAAYNAAKSREIEKAIVFQKKIFELMDLMNMEASVFSIMKYSLAAVGIGQDINAYHTEPLTKIQKQAVTDMARHIRKFIEEQKIL